MKGPRPVRRFATSVLVVMAVVLTGSVSQAPAAGASTAAVVPAAVVHAVDYTPPYAPRDCDTEEPRLTFGLSVYINACGATWKAYEAAALAVAGGGAITGCAALVAKVPQPIIIKLCRKLSWEIVKFVISAVPKIIKSKQPDERSCYQLAMGPRSHGKIVEVGLKNCLG